VVAALFGREELFECFPEIVADGICAAHHRAMTGSALARKNSSRPPAWRTEMTC
jgi:hypothetical protein